MLREEEAIVRESCCENLEWSKTPITIKRLAFANACIKMWKVQIQLFPTDKDKNIRPSWLKVESATTFLASCSSRAEKLAIKRVIKPSLPKIVRFNKFLRPNRRVSHTPAVTKVELWTKALTGVGAAIAAGNHLINGHWALFVRAKAKNIRLKIKLLRKKKHFHILKFNNKNTVKAQNPPIDS